MCLYLVEQNVVYFISYWLSEASLSFSASKHKNIWVWKRSLKREIEPILATLPAKGLNLVQKVFLFCFKNWTPAAHGLSRVLRLPSSSLLLSPEKLTSRVTRKINYAFHSPVLAQRLQKSWEITIIPFLDGSLTQKSERKLKIMYDKVENTYYSLLLIFFL